MKKREKQHAEAKKNGLLKTQGSEQLSTQDSKALEIISLKISDLEKDKQEYSLLRQPLVWLTNKTLKVGGLVLGLLSVP